jgi:uncharacterized protein YciI
MNTFIIIYRPGAAWLAGKPRAEQSLQEHGKYLLGQYRDGRLRFAGPFEDDAGGMAVIEALSLEEAQAIVDHDPAVLKQILVYEIHPLQLIPWERYVNVGD